MAEYIERETAIAKLTALEVTEPSATMIDAKRLLAEMPAADVAPVVHGKWIFGVLEVLGTPVRCSVCGWSAPIVDADMWLRYPGHHFCGACGAKMDGKGE